MRGLRLTLLIIVTFLLAACTSLSQPTPDAIIDVKLGLPPYLSNAPFLIAIEEGFFEDEGLNVEVIPLERTSNSITAIIQGDIHVAAGSLQVNWLNAMAANAGVKIVAGKGYFDPNGCYNSLIVSPEIVKNGEVDISLINGSKVRIGEAQFVDYVSEYALKNAGVDPDSLDRLDVEQSALFEILKTGDLTLSFVAEPYRTTILQSGNGVLWMNDGDFLPGFQYAYVYFGPRLLEDLPEVGERFMRGYLRGVQQFRQGKTDQNVEILANGTGLEKTFLLDACWPTIKEVPAVNIQDLLDFQDWAVSKGYMEDILPAEQFYDSRFIDHAIEARSK